VEFIKDLIENHHLTTSLLVKHAINDDDDEVVSDATRHSRDEEAINMVFRCLMILTSLQFCVANGSHNVANAISPLLNVY
jgi:phosphate/sulfate permease